MIVVATKIDAANPEKLKKLTAHVKRRKLEFHAISAVTGQGIDELKWALAKRLETHRHGLTGPSFSYRRVVFTWSAYGVFTHRSGEPH